MWDKLRKGFREEPNIKALEVCLLADIDDFDKILVQFIT